MALPVPLLIPRIPNKLLNATSFLAVFPIVSFFLWSDGGPPPPVQTSLWGGPVCHHVLPSWHHTRLPHGHLAGVWGDDRKTAVIKISAQIFMDVRACRLAPCCSSCTA